MQLKIYFDRKTRGVDGFLTVMDETKGQKVFDRLHARSGQAGYTDTSWVRARSPIPYGRFNLHTAPNNKGQRAGRSGIGEFFPVDTEGDRYTLKSLNKKYVRTEIGLHEENDYVGSAGCIVIVNSRDWINLSSFLRGINVDTIPLEVL